jgi:hypothetical protein
MVFGALLLGGLFAFTRLPLELAPSKEFRRLFCSRPFCLSVVCAP